LRVFRQNKNRRLFLFISEPEESDHDYQPVGGTGEFLNINVFILGNLLISQKRGYLRKFTKFRNIYRFFLFEKGLGCL
jgi:hypothetical protein